MVSAKATPGWSNDKSRIHKLRGAVLSVDLVNHVITIQPSEHEGKKARRLTVTPESQFHAGEERKTVADVMTGEWVRAYFVYQGEQAILKKLYMPRSMGVDFRSP